MTSKRRRVESGSASNSSQISSSFLQSHNSYRNTPSNRPLPRPNHKARGPFPQSSASSTPSLPLLLPSHHQTPFRPVLRQSPIAASCQNKNEDRDPFAEDESEIVARENIDSINETVMAIDMRDRGTIGCAYYVAREAKLYLMEDVKMASVDLVDTLKIHASPTVILINSRSDEKLEERLISDARCIDRGEYKSKSSIYQHIMAANHA